MPMTIEELAENLIKITARLPENQADQVRQFISCSRTKTLGLVAQAANNNNEAQSSNKEGVSLADSPSYLLILNGQRIATANRCCS
jgi:Cdc6-like AAA superfamily ATPase